MPVDSDAEHTSPDFDAGTGAFNQDDIDALLDAQADRPKPPPSADPAPRSAESAADDRLSADDVEALTAAAASMASGPEQRSTGRASRAVAATGSPVAETEAPAEPRVGGPFEFPPLGEPGRHGVDPKRVSMLNDVKLRVKIELGRTRMLVEDVLKLDEGSVVELDKLAGDPVDVFVNDRLIARGEVLVLNDNFCVRVSEVLSHDPHRVSA
jgi:flagellar motor switch protein FliN/FliY